MLKVKIDNRVIGSTAPCFVIAEAGVNHNGDLDIAKQLVEVAVASGVDAVKFQTFKAEKVVSAAAPKADYQLQTTAEDEFQYAMLKKLELSFDAHQVLKTFCQDRDIIFMSTPFDEESADFLESLGIPVYKIPSGEITNQPLIEHIARKNKPIILSTGMSSLTEVSRAVDWIKGTGNDQLVLLHCVSNYPADPTEVKFQSHGCDGCGFPNPDRVFRSHTRD